MIRLDRLLNMIHTEAFENEQQVRNEMSWDIYGERLKAGFCEVHPWIGESYPCSECEHTAEESRRLQAEQDAYYAAEADHYYRQQFIEHFEETTDEGAFAMGGLS